MSCLNVYFTTEMNQKEWSVKPPRDVLSKAVMLKHGGQRNANNRTISGGHKPAATKMPSFHSIRYYQTPELNQKHFHSSPLKNFIIIYITCLASFDSVLVKSFYCIIWIVITTFTSLFSSAGFNGAHDAICPSVQANGLIISFFAPFILQLTLWWRLLQYIH